MASTTKVPLGAATLVRKWYLDVNTGTYASPTWVGVFGVEEFKFSYDPTTQDDSDYDSGGWKSSMVTAQGWSLEFKVARKVTAASATDYDAGQEKLRTTAQLMGTSNVVDVRWYEVTSGGPKTEAYRGYAVVQWVPDGGAMDALDTVSVTCMGRGAFTAITHPDGAPSAVPVLLAATPAAGAAAGGWLCTIGGVRFTGVTGASGVTVGSTNVTSYQVQSDNSIVAVMPAKTAGSYSIVVTNGTGPSTVNVSVTYS